MEESIFNNDDPTPDLSHSKDADKLIAIYRHPFKIVNPK